MNSSGILFPAQHLFPFLMITKPWLPSGKSRSLTLYGLGRADCGSGCGHGQSSYYIPGLVIIQMGTSYPNQANERHSEFVGCFVFLQWCQRRKAKPKWEPNLSPNDVIWDLESNHDQSQVFICEPANSLFSLGEFKKDSVAFIGSLGLPWWSSGGEFACRYSTDKKK